MEETELIPRDVEGIVALLSDQVLMQNLEDQVGAPILDALSPTNFLEIFNDRFGIRCRVHAARKFGVEEVPAHGNEGRLGCRHRQSSQPAGANSRSVF